MRRIATFVVSAIGLGLTMCPMAQADPLSYQDSVYTKWLSEIGVNYQNRVTTEMMIAQAHTTCAMLDQNPTPQSYQAAVNRLVGGPGNFTKKEADGTVQAAVHSYCDAHSNLIYS
jgi:hypothetical protein